MPRPKGSLNKRTLVSEFVEREPELQKRVVELALEGDPTSLKIIADRLWPRIRPQSMAVKVDADKADSLAELGDKVLSAAMSGKISTDQARDLLAAITDQARVAELTEIEQRLAALEQHEDVPPWEPPEKLPIRGRRKRKENV